MTKRTAVDEQIVAVPTESGIRARVAVKKGYAKKYALVMAEYGSIDNEFTIGPSKRATKMPHGIAHFLEHKMFEKKDGDISDRFARFGATANAMTSFESTAYFFECTENFEANLEILMELVAQPYFTQKLVDKEKGIIAQEIRMYEDDPSWRGSVRVLKNLYGKHPVAVDIAGTVESIAGITADDLATCHRAFYAPDSLTLSMAGDLDPVTAVAAAERALRRIGRDPAPAVVRRYPAARKAPTGISREVADVRSSKVFGGWRVPIDGARGEALIDIETALDLYVGTVFSTACALHKKLFGKGLIDDSFSVSTTVEREFAFVTWNGDTPDPEALLAGIIDGVDAVRKDGLGKAEMRRIRRRMYGGYVKGFNSLENVAWNVAECLAKDVDYLKWGERLMALTDDRALAIGRRALSPENFSAHVIDPKTKS